MNDDDDMLTQPLYSSGSVASGINTTILSPSWMSSGSYGAALQTSTISCTDTITISPSWNDGSWSGGTWNNIHPSIKVHGDADISGDIKLKGKSLADTLDNIEKRLAILHPNTALESKWEELKALGDRYRELEKDILEKELICDILKK